MIDELVEAIELYFKNEKNVESIVKIVITDILSNYNRLFDYLREGREYSEKLVQSCHLSMDDVTYLKNFKEINRTEFKKELIERDLKVESQINELTV